MRNHYQFILFLFFLPFGSYGQTGCPGCTVSLPALPLDTIFLEQAPDGYLFAPYDEDISFRLPISTDPVHAVDPDTPAGIDINSITITSVENLPFGLFWETNQSEFDIPGGETDGCVKLCGTPEEFGLFEVEVVLTAQILFLNQTTSFTFFINILPNTSTTDGFSVDNTQGCSEVVTVFSNNVPSNGADGFTYLWDFGNGFSSSLETPDTVIYDEPGDYTVNYEAIIDTSAYFLDEVKILSSDCTDFLGRPDIYIEVRDDLGALVYTSATVSNVDFPVTYNTHVNIGSGTYRLTAIDDDGGINGGDDLCGEITFTQMDNGLFDISGLSLIIEINHRVDTVRSSDIIHVYDLPTPVEITGSATTLDCAGQMATLSTSSTEHLQWQHDGVAIVGATEQVLEISEPGAYTCIYTSDEGCSVISPEYYLVPTPFDVVVDYVEIGNYLVLSDPAQLDGMDYSLQWYLNGQPIEGAVDLGYCIQISGTYTLEVTNTATQCTASADISAFYDEFDANCITAIEPVNSLEMSVYPNPVSDLVYLEWPADLEGRISYNLYNQIGQLVKHENDLKDRSIDLENLPVGIYFLEVIVGEQSNRLKLVRQ